MMGLRGGRVVAALAGLLALAVVGYALGRARPGADQAFRPAAERCHGTTLRVWSSTEPGLARAVPTTGEPGVLQRVAKALTCVEVVAVGSEQARGYIMGLPENDEADKLPDVWLPAHSFWNTLVGPDYGQYSDELGSFASSRLKLYVKIGSPLDAALGDAGSTTWRKLAEQARAGRLNLVKQNTLASTSGALATILASEAAVGGDSFSADDVRAGKLDSLAGPIERSVTSYPGEIGDYLSSFASPLDRAELPDSMLLEDAVFRILPRLSPFYRAVELAGPDPAFDHPFLLRPGMDAGKRARAVALQQALVSGKVQAELAAVGFAPSTGKSALSIPSTDAVQTILNHWPEMLRKHVSLAVTIDQSGSITPYEKQVAAAMINALRSLSRTDRAAIYGFPGPGGAVHELLSVPQRGTGDPGNPTTMQIPRLKKRPGGSPLIEAVRQTTDLLRDEAGNNGGDQHKQAVLVITDGQESGTGSPADVESDAERIRAYRKAGVQVFFLVVGTKPLCVVDRVYSSVPSDCGSAGRPAGLAQDERGWVYCVADRPDCPTPTPAPSASALGYTPQSRIPTIFEQIFDRLGGSV